MWIIVLLLALVAPARADATWDQVAALAKPTAKRGSSKQLAAAMAIAEKHEREWSINRAETGGIAGYPEAPAALAALAAWRKDNGGLPPEASPIVRGKRAVAMMRLGQVAIATADLEHRANLELAMYLAATMIEDGDNFLVVMSATSLVTDAKDKAAKLVVATDKWPVPHAELVRVVAAEAITEKASNDWARTPAGKKAIDDALKAMDPKTRKVSEQTVGAPLVPPTDEQAATLSAFFLKALDGAKRDEPAATTLARVHAAAGSDPVSSMIDRMVILVSNKL